MSSSTDGTASTQPAETTTDNSAPPATETAPVVAPAAEPATPVKVSPTHHYFLHGVITILEGVARTLEKDFSELSSELKTFIFKIKSKL